MHHPVPSYTPYGDSSYGARMQGQQRYSSNEDHARTGYNPLPRQMSDSYAPIPPSLRSQHAASEDQKQWRTVPRAWQQQSHEEYRAVDDPAMRLQRAHRQSYGTQELGDLIERQARDLRAPSPKYAQQLGELYVEQPPYAQHPQPQYAQHPQTPYTQQPQPPTRENRDNPQLTYSRVQYYNKGHIPVRMLNRWSGESQRDGPYDGVGEVRDHEYEEYLRERRYY